MPPKRLYLAFLLAALVSACGIASNQPQGPAAVSAAATPIAKELAQPTNAPAKSGIPTRLAATAAATGAPLPSSDEQVKQAAALISQGDYVGANDLLTTVLEHEPNNTAAHFYRGRAKYELNSLEEALDDFNEAVRLNPQDAEALFQRARTYHGLNDYEQAMADYNAAIALRPNYARPYKSRGNLYYDLGDIQASIDDDTRAIELDPKYVDAYNDRAVSRMAMGNYKGAIADDLALLQIDPNVPYAAQVYCGLGQSYYELGRYNDAEASCSKALEINPNMMTAHFNRSKARYALANFQGAVDDLTTYIDADPTYPPAYENRGAAYLQLKQIAAARNDYQRALELYQQYGNTQGAKRVQEALARL